MSDNELNQKVVGIPSSTDSVCAENGNALFQALATTGTFAADPQMRIAGNWVNIPVALLTGPAPIVGILAPVVANGLPANCQVRLNVTAVAPDVDLQIQG